jgi:hypothetical protein
MMNSEKTVRISILWQHRRPQKSDCLEAYIALSMCDLKKLKLEEYRFLTAIGQGEEMQLIATEALLRSGKVG